MDDDSLFPLPVLDDYRGNEGIRFGQFREIIATYWNPDGTRWRRFDPEKILKKMREGKYK